MKRGLLVLSSFLFGGLISARADVIYVSGEVSGTWSADSVIVTGEVRIPPNESLTIAPGTQVLFQNMYKFIVDQNATLTAVGTATDSIRFDRLYLWVHWHGIHFQSASPNSQLEYCQILHGQTTAFPDWSGGGIYCNQSSPTIRHCLIAECSAEGDGGGIYLAFSNPLITDNSFIANEAVYNGGGVYCGGWSSPTIAGNSFLGNNAMWYYGGGLCVWGTGSPEVYDNTFMSNTAIATGGGGSGGGLALLDAAITVHDNVFTNNSACWVGGGIFCHSTNSSITENVLIGNSASDGGGIGCDELAGLTISHNLITQNSAEYGGGIYCGDGLGIWIINNTIVSNSASEEGGGVCYGYRNILLENDILCANSPQQIYTLSPQYYEVTYCDVQGGWSGEGNINANPLFANPAGGDYYLTWPSPCINAGDPLSPLDPDSTRADMGAYYFDYSALAVELTMIPEQSPVQIPASGGSFSFTAEANNISGENLPIDFWTQALLPDSTFRGPIMPPVRVTLTPGGNSGARNQNVPGGAPAGMYDYRGYIGIYPHVILAQDAFPVEKLAAGSGLWMDDWAVSGDPFVSTSTASRNIAPAESIPCLYSTCAPNPFNASTVLSFELRVPSFVKLEVFDVSGSLVGAHGCAPFGGGSTPALQYFSAGTHHLTFDGSNLPSGIYFTKLAAGDYSVVQKLVLLK